MSSSPRSSTKKVLFFRSEKAMFKHKKERHNLLEKYFSSSVRFYEEMVETRRGTYFRITAFKLTNGSQKRKGIWDEIADDAPMRDVENNELLEESCKYLYPVRGLDRSELGGSHGCPRRLWDRFL